MTVSFSVREHLIRTQFPKLDIDIGLIDASVTVLLTNEKDWFGSIVEYIRSVFGSVTPGSVTDLRRSIHLLAKQSLTDQVNFEKAAASFCNSLVKRVEILGLDSSMTDLFASTLLDKALSQKSVEEDFVVSLANKCAELSQESDELEDCEQEEEVEVEISSFVDTEKFSPSIAGVAPNRSFKVVTAAALGLGLLAAYQLSNLSVEQGFALAESVRDVVAPYFNVSGTPSFDLNGVVPSIPSLNLSGFVASMSALTLGLGRSVQEMTAKLAVAPESISSDYDAPLVYTNTSS